MAIKLEHLVLFLIETFVFSNGIRRADLCYDSNYDLCEKDHKALNCKNGVILLSTPKFFINPSPCNDHNNCVVDEGLAETNSSPYSHELFRRCSAHESCNMSHVDSADFNTKTSVKLMFSCEGRPSLNPCEELSKTFESEFSMQVSDNSGRHSSCLCEVSSQKPATLTVVPLDIRFQNEVAGPACHGNFVRVTRRVDGNDHVVKEYNCTNTPVIYDANVNDSVNGNVTVSIGWGPVDQPEMVWIKIVPGSEGPVTVSCSRLPPTTRTTQTTASITEKTETTSQHNGTVKLLEDGASDEDTAVIATVAVVMTLLASGLVVGLLLVYRRKKSHRITAGTSGTQQGVTVNPRKSHIVSMSSPEGEYELDSTLDRESQTNVRQTGETRSDQIDGGIYVGEFPVGECPETVNAYSSADFRTLSPRIDATYSHIPRTNTTNPNDTYSHLATSGSQHQQNDTYSNLPSGDRNNSDMTGTQAAVTCDSDDTYNRLGEDWRGTRTGTEQTDPSEGDMYSRSNVYAPPDQHRHLEDDYDHLDGTRRIES